MLRRSQEALKALRLGPRAAEAWEGKVKPALGRCARSRRLKRVLAVGVLAAAGSMGWLYVTIRRAAAVQPTKPADAIIVLGAGSLRAVGLPRHVYRARLLYARDLYERGMAPNIIVTEQSPAAEIARDYLVKVGVPEEAVRFENRSTTTWENLSYARDVMRDEGWQTAIVVSCGFHMFRSLKMSEELGLSAQGAATPYSHIEKDSRKRIRFTLRECEMYLAHLLSGR